YPQILRLCILSSQREGRNASTTISCLEKGMLVWINWKKPCPMKTSIDLCYGRRQEKINSETSLIQRLQRRQNSS
ncbi:PREDICTED: LOC18780761, partial [Prunus dulcis]